MTLETIGLIIGIMGGAATIAGTIWATWKATIREQKQQTEALAMAIELVIEKAVIKEQRHQSHEHRLDKLEHDQKETVQMIEKKFDKIDRQLETVIEHLIQKK